MSDASHLEPARPTRGADLVSYSEQAIVSRTLAKSAAGSLTAFSFDKGQEISEHTTSSEAFAFGLEGKIEFIVGGQRVELGEGALLRLPASVPHSLLAKSKSKMLLVMLKDA